MPWLNPFWGSLKGPDAEILRAIFQSLQDWTRNPSFGNVTDPGPASDAPQALKVFNEYIRSSNYVAGSAGWQINATGEAEFNNVTVRGTISGSTITGSTITGSVYRSSSSGRRVEINTLGDASKVWFISANGETVPGSVTSEFNSTGGYETLKIYSPQFSLGQSSIELTQAATIHLSARQNTIRGHGPSTALLVSHTLGGEALSVSGPTRLNGRVAMNNDHVYISNRLYVGTDTTHSVGSNIVSTGGASGILIGQRNRSHTDLTQSWEIYGNGDRLNFYAHGWGDFQSHAQVGGWHDWRVHNLPGIVGGFLCIAGSGQIGPDGSSERFKRDIETFGGGDNPVWKMRPVRYKFDPEHVSNADEFNERVPEGMTGLLAEEVSQVAPDAVHLDTGGLPASLNHGALIAYNIKALQELKDRIKRIEAIPAIAAALKGTK